MPKHHSSKPDPNTSLSNTQQPLPVRPDASIPATPPKSTWQKFRSLLWFATKYLILFVVIYTVVNWWRQPVMPANPDLQLTDYQGQHVDIEALSHQTPVLVYFWGSWCGICQITSPTINSLANTSPYPVVTIATQSGSPQELAYYMTNNSFTFTTVNDESGEIFKAWEGQVTPSYVILNNGEMTQGLTGIQPEWSLRLRLWISSLLN